MRFARMSKGFTLIELIIVVAVIGIITTVIFAFLDEARENSRNKTKGQTVEQYIRAIELVRNDLGNYPTPVDSWNCLGDGYVGGTCISTWDEDPTLNGLLQQYIDTPNGGPQPAADRKGFMYNNSGSASYNYEIRWFLEGTNRDCAPAQTVISGDYNGEGITYCSYRHY